MLQQFSIFKGELPRVTTRLLSDEYAQLAVNCRMENGALAPVRASTFITDLVTPRKSIYLKGAVWEAFSGNVVWLPGPTATDRLYRFGEATPKMIANDTTYELALPAPATGPTLTNLQEPDPEELETILYAVTYVTSYGEESAPSPLSNALEWSEGVAVRLSAIPAPPAGRAITAMRIYRSNTSLSGTTDLYFVAEAAVATTFDHDISLTPLGEVISTIDHTTPPDGLRGVVSMPNGMFVGHTDREIHFSEPYQPHTWPAKYARVVDYDIQGLAAFGSQLAIMTKGTPYRGQGSHPDTFQLERIEENLPCVSPYSIVDLGYAAAYASTDGLVSITGSGVQLISRGLFTAQQWHDLTPSSIVAAQHKGRYAFAFSGTLPSGTETTGMIDLTGDQPFFLRMGIKANSFYYDLRTSTLYFQDAGDNQLYEWDDPANPTHLPLAWKSAPLDLGFPVAFAAIYIEGSATGPFTCKVLADGVVKATYTSLNKPHRLPSGFKAQHWALEVEGQVNVQTIALASSLADLANLK